jgi:hypothetical protein
MRGPQAALEAGNAPPFLGIISLVLTPGGNVLASWEHISMFHGPTCHGIVVSKRPNLPHHGRTGSHEASTFPAYGSAFAGMS